MQCRDLVCVRVDIILWFFLLCLGRISNVLDKLKSKSIIILLSIVVV